MLGAITALIQDDPEYSEEPPLVLIHDGGGTTINYYYLGNLERYVWGISNEKLVDDTAWPGGIKQLAQTYVDLVLRELPRGPLVLGGWSVGGLIALEMARILAGNTDTRVLGVVMMDTYYPSTDDGGGDRDTSAIEWGEATTEESKASTLKCIANSAKFSRQWGRDARNESVRPGLPPVILLRASESHGASDARIRGGNNVLGWASYRPDFFAHVLDVPGNHYNLFADENVDGLTDGLSQAYEILEEAEGLSGFPLLRTIVDNYEIVSVLPCSEEQRRALKSWRDFDNQTTLFKLQMNDGEDICIERLEHAWQRVVQQKAALRTVFAIGSNTTELFQVVIKNYHALFTHAHLGETDDLEASVEQEPLPILATGAPMHIAQVYTAKGVSPLLRFCYNGIAIQDDCLVGLQTDLPRVYHALANPESPPGVALVAQVGEKSAPHYMLERIQHAEPTILGLGMIEEQKTTAEYTNVTMPGSLGEALLLQCSESGVTPTNMLQALWLILLAKYLRLEQPCCMYRLSPSDSLTRHNGSGRFARRDFLCTEVIADDDQIIDLAKRLHEQTVQDRRADAQTLSASMHGDKRLCNSAVCWHDANIASGTQDHVLSIQPIKAEGLEEHEVTLTLIHSGAELSVQLQTGRTVERWLAKSITEMFVQSLEYVLSYPACRIKDIPSCSPADIKMMQEWNGGELPRQENCIHEMVRDQARLRPDAPAVVAHDGSLSYAELEALTNRVANAFFTTLKLQHEEKVILQFPHSLWTIVAMMAVMKAGAAFIPLDENIPLDRVKSIASKANARLVLTANAPATKYDVIGLQTVILDQSFVNGETLSEATAWARDDTKPSDLAYVIFTSGSTGEPKGCAVEHRAFCSYAAAFGPALHVGPGSRVLQSTSYSFDVSLKEILLGLLAGACLCVPSDHDLMNDVGGAAARLGANYANFTPSVVSHLNLEAGAGAGIRTLVLGGEALTADVIAAWAPRVDLLLGGYGPSEVCPTSAVTGPLSPRSHPRNIGRPAGARAWVVDPSDHDRLLPAGAVGELVLESHAVGRGYIGDEERTARVFIADPAWCARPELRAAETAALGAARRMYKTGDLVARCADGSLLYFGRKDMQVKLRGQRIELGDVEAHLKAVVPADLAVEVGVPRGGGDEDKMLVAFVCLGPQSSAAPPADLSSVDAAAQAQLHALLGEAEEQLARRVARYMVPAAYIPLRALPVTTSGKRDRRALQRIITSLSKQELLAWRRPAGETSPARPPTTDMERRVAGLWARVLKVGADELSLDDDFVGRGGDSLAAMRLANMAKAAGLRLTFRDIYRRSRVLGDQVEICLKNTSASRTKLKRGEGWR
ncbi:acetyl-CoA synthetase-like protein [Xylaria palmicola]|nr:acetyl-CoA synthetase-like protein [Xylaria palmicola]